MRILLALESDGSTFVQAEWQDRAGLHTRRLNDDLPPNITAAVKSFMDWAINHRDTALAPATEESAELVDIEQEIGRLQRRQQELRLKR